VNLEELVEDLSTLGIAHEVRRTGSDGAVLLLPEYGRVLGLWPHWRGENALWVNTDFFRSLHGGAKDDGWLNPGGDRIWLAPADEFLGDGGVVPPSIDPGRFMLSSDRGALRMTNGGEAWARRTGVRVRFRITRRVTPLDEKALDADWGPSWLRRAGYNEEIVLEIEGKCPVPVGLWSVAQVPAASQVLGDDPRGPHPGTGMCIEDPDSDRARLLVKTYTPPGDSAPAAVDAGEPRSRQLSCVSPVVTPGGKRRLTWRVSVCTVSGRSTEIQQLASRMLYSTHIKE
jgi:hypothetical protein